MCKMLRLAIDDQLLVTIEPGGSRVDWRDSNMKVMS